MDNCETLRTIVQIHDRPILKQLKDIRYELCLIICSSKIYLYNFFFFQNFHRVVTSPLFMETREKTTSGNMGFRIEFHFSPNDFFRNEVLYKVN